MLEFFKRRSNTSPPVHVRSTAADEVPISKGSVIFLYRGLSAFFPVDLFRTNPPAGGGKEGKTYPTVSFWGGFEKEEFRNFVLSVTNEEILIKAINRVLLWKKAYDQGSLPDATIPPELNEKVEALEKERAKGFVDVKKIKELASSLKVTGPKEKKVILKPKAEKKVSLSREEKGRLGRLQKTARENPNDLFNLVRIEIVKRAPEDIRTQTPDVIFENTANTVALEFVERLRQDASLPARNQAWVLSTFANPNSPILLKRAKNEVERKKLAEAAQALALVAEHERKVKKDLLLNIIGGKVFDYLHGPDDACQYEETDKEDKETLSLSLDGISDTYEEYTSSTKRIYSALEAENTSYVQSYGQEAFDLLLKRGRWKTILRESVVFTKEAAASFFTKSGILPVSASLLAYKGTSSLLSAWAASATPLLAPKVAGLLGAGSSITQTAFLTTPYKVFDAAGHVIKVGFADVIPVGTIPAQVVVKRGFAQGIRAIFSGGLKGIFSAIGKTAVGKGISAVFAALGSVVPVVGTIIGFLIGEIATRILPKIFTFLKRRTRDLTMLLSGGLMLAGIVVASPLLFATGLIAGLGRLSMQAGGLSSAASGLGGFFGAFLAGLTAVVIPAFAIPVLVASLALVIFTVFTIFIINSGAYVVPPDTEGFLSLDSPYISVTKTPGKTSLPSSELPTEIEFTVTVGAKKGTLSNIRVKDICKAIKGANERGCFTPTIPVPSPPQTVSPASPFEFIYKVPFDRSFSDWIVINGIEVTADAEEEKNVSAQASSSIVIGNPDLSCFEFSGSWNTSSLSRIVAAIGEIQRVPAFAGSACKGGKIKLIASPQVSIWGGWYREPGEIVIYPLGIRNHPTSVYTLAHELGHHLGTITNLFVKYLDTAGLREERPICTYPNLGRSETSSPSAEDFAESIALYLADSPRIGKYFSCLDGQGKSFKSKYPNHWKFVKDNIAIDTFGW